MAETYDMETLAKAAKAGDADAQYRLASLLVQSGDEAERGVDWLRKAAAAGHANARYTLALMTLAGQLVPKKPERAVSLLETIAEKGHAPARQILAVLYTAGEGISAPDWDKALALTLDTAEAGDPGALRDLGLVASLIGLSDAFVHACLLASATRGDLMAAAALVVRFGDGDDRLEEALVKTWAKGLAEAGHPLAAIWDQAMAVEPLAEAPAPTPIPEFDEEARAKLASALQVTVMGSRLLDRPQVDMVRDFVPRTIAAHLIGLGAPALVADGDGEKGPFRAVLGLMHMDLCLAVLSCRLASAAGADASVEPILVEALPAGVGGPVFDGASGERVRASAMLALSDPLSSGGLVLGPDGHLERGVPGTLYVMHHRLADERADPDAYAENLSAQGGVRWQALRLIV